MIPTERNKSIVRRYLEEVWGQGRYSSLRELFSPNVLDHDAAPGQPCGLDGLEWAVRRFLDNLCNATMTAEQLVAEGDRVMVRWTLSAVHTGELYGVPATGRPFTITGAGEVCIEGGKIVEIWHRADMLSILQQLGSAPTLPLPKSLREAHPPAGRRGAGDYSTLPEEDVKGRVRQAFAELIDRGDLAAVDEFIAPGYVGHLSGLPTVYGRDGFWEFASLYRHGLVGLRLDVEDLLVEGEWAALRGTYYGTHMRWMFRLPATGKPVALRTLMMLRMEGDKLAEQWANSDDLRLLEQLGAVAEMGEGERVPC